MIQEVAHFIHSYENLYPRSARINDSNTYTFQRNIMWKNLYDRMYKYIYMWENIFKVSSFFAPCWIYNAYYSSGSRTVIEKKTNKQWICTCKSRWIRKCLLSFICKWNSKNLVWNWKFVLRQFGILMDIKLPLIIFYSNIWV